MYLSSSRNSRGTSGTASTDQSSDHRLNAIAGRSGVSALTRMEVRLSRVSALANCASLERATSRWGATIPKAPRRDFGGHSKSKRKRRALLRRFKEVGQLKASLVRPPL